MVISFGLAMGNSASMSFPASFGECLLQRAAFLLISVEELVCDSLFLRCVLADEDRLHAELVKALQIVPAATLLLPHRPSALNALG